MQLWCIVLHTNKKELYQFPHIFGASHKVSKKLDKIFYKFLICRGKVALFPPPPCTRMFWDVAVVQPHKPVCLYLQECRRSTQSTTFLFLFCVLFIASRFTFLNCSPFVSQAVLFLPSGGDASIAQHIVSSRFAPCVYLQFLSDAGLKPRSRLFSNALSAKPCSTNVHALAGAFIVQSVI